MLRGRISCLLLQHCSASAAACLSTSTAAAAAAAAARAAAVQAPTASQDAGAPAAAAGAASQQQALPFIQQQELLTATFEQLHRDVKQQHALQSAQAEVRLLVLIAKASDAEQVQAALAAVRANHMKRHRIRQQQPHGPRVFSALLKAGQRTGLGHGFAVQLLQQAPQLGLQVSLNMCEEVLLSCIKHQDYPAASLTWLYAKALCMHPSSGSSSQQAAGQQLDAAAGRDSSSSSQEAAGQQLDAAAGRDSSSSSSQEAAGQQLDAAAGRGSSSSSEEAAQQQLDAAAGHGSSSSSSGSSQEAAGQQLDAAAVRESWASKALMHLYARGLARWLQQGGLPRSYERRLRWELRGLAQELTMRGAKVPQVVQQALREAAASAGSSTDGEGQAAAAGEVDAAAAAGVEGSAAVAAADSGKAPSEA